MSWYYTFIDLLIYLFIAVMTRHLLLRSRYFLHMFQLSGYQFRDYSRWLKKHWHSRVITPEHIFFLIIVFSLVAFVSDQLTESATALVITIFGIFWFGPTRFYGKGGEKKPLVYTARMTRLIVPFGIITVFIPLLATQLAFSRTMLIADVPLLGFGWLLGDLLVPFLIYLGAGINYPLEKLINRYYKRTAHKKLQQRSDLTVIAITGSYGKTSTKFMVRDLLGERFSVCVTPSSYNTPMGICKVINNQLSGRHQVLVLEMGARYPGNIAELCDIAPPDIAIVTNVGIAHLETFGSEDRIARTKSEIVQNLKEGGRAVLNADDERVKAMADLRSDVEVTYTSIESDEGDLCASNIQYDEQGTRFQIRFNTKSVKVSTRLLGKHNVMNILQATAIARQFGLRMDTIRVAIGKLEPVEHRLELKRENSILVIDDAFNSNPVGARNAVETLAQFNQGRKAVITPGMIELGEREEEENRELGSYMGKVGLDLYILVGEERTEPIVEGLQEVGVESDRIWVCKSLHEANNFLRSWVREGDVVLYENDLPDSYN